MDMIARRAFERPDVQAHGAGCNPRQHGSCLARGHTGSQDVHEAIAFEFSVPGSCRGDGDGISVEPLKFYRCSILLISEKLATRSAPAPWRASLPKDLGDAVRMPSLDRRSRLSQVELDLLLFC